MAGPWCKQQTQKQENVKQNLFFLLLNGLALAVLLAEFGKGEEEVEEEERL